MTDSINSILPSIEVKTFPSIKKFNAGGMLISGADSSIVYYKKALYTCTKCHNIGDLYLLSRHPPFSLYFCPGNQPPEVEHQGMLGTTHTHQVPCAGVSSPHFHVKCSVCDYVELLSLPEESNG